MVEFTILALKRPFQIVGLGPFHQFHLFSAKTANFLDFPFSTGEPIAVSGGKGDRNDCGVAVLLCDGFQPKDFST